ASLPVQEYLFMPFDQAHKQYETARHLPPPLYVLFVQATAYGQACAHMKSSQPPRQDKTLSVAIEGSVDEAKALFKPPDDSQDDESDSDAEEEQTTKRRRPTLGVQLDDKRKEMLKRHPLSVMLDLKCKDDSVLHLTFYYLMNLNIMTVKAKVTTATELITPISAGYWAGALGSDIRDGEVVRASLRGCSRFLPLALERSTAVLSCIQMDQKSWRIAGILESIL
ncbi:THO complex subunit 5 homolog, partial [Piliocolobus tephrosceles]|uniref:THO complex subunit 5 homolog n=1 Tax=Piliocolobus tephrosceles TaxID=591936 RepID=UPI000E6AF80E